MRRSFMRYSEVCESLYAVPLSAGWQEVEPEPEPEALIAQLRDRALWLLDQPADEPVEWSIDDFPLGLYRITTGSAPCTSLSAACWQWASLCCSGAAVVTRHR